MTEGGRSILEGNGKVTPNAETDSSVAVAREPAAGDAAQNAFLAALGWGARTSKSLWSWLRALPGYLALVGTASVTALTLVVCLLVSLYNRFVIEKQLLDVRASLEAAELIVARELQNCRAAKGVTSANLRPAYTYCTSAVAFFRDSWGSLTVPAAASVLRTREAVVPAADRCKAWPGPQNLDQLARAIRALQGATRDVTVSWFPSIKEWLVWAAGGDKVKPLGIGQPGKPLGSV